MLLEISIKNFAIIEAISLNFEKGMTVLTGETGAGKSIIIDAMNMMLGARATTDVIRHGAPKAEIEGLFSVENSRLLQEIFDEQGLELGDEIIIRREILQNGRSISRVNGQMVNLSVLRAIGQHLVDIHGQHDHEELMRPQLHIQMLDEFGDAAFWDLKETYQTSFDAYRKMRKQVLEVKKNQQEHKARIEMLEFQMAEIEAANLQAGEDLALNQERDKLLNHKNIADTLTNAYSMLDNEDFSSLANVRSAMNDMESVEEYDPEYREISSSLSETYYVLEDISKRLEAIIEDLDFDGNRLMQVENRLDLLHTITRKYGGTVDDVLLYFAKITEEYNLLTGNNLSSEDMEAELKKLEVNLVNLAGQLASARHNLAQQLEAEIKQELQDLYMEKAQFQVRFSKGKFSREGNKMVEFYISTNPGEDFKPLVKVASGGELSRLMLAIKSAFSRKEGKTSIVFDEVDTGVSGRVAQAIAQKIHKIGQHGNDLREALEKLQLNDASLQFEPETSQALGFGFRCGFLGLLHMDVIQERLEREFNIDLIMTAPSVIYKVNLTDGESMDVSNPSEFPDPTKIATIEEPYVKAQIMVPQEFVGAVMELAQRKRGDFVTMDYIDDNRVNVIYQIPLAEIVFDFFDKLKSSTRGYASFDYELSEYRPSKLVKMDILLNGDKVDALSFIVHKDFAYERGKLIVDKLKKIIPRQQFEVPIQAAIGHKIVARTDIKALRKNVLAKCYGGDVSRKRKLLEKQKAGKKRMKSIGSVEVPQEAFLSVLSMDEE